MKSIWASLGILLALALVVVFVSLSSKPQIETTMSPIPDPPAQEQGEVDFRASFAIFTNGTFRIFTDSRYHGLSPDVYIATPDVNVVTVKKAGVTWNDFFKTLPMKLERDCLTTGTGQVFCANETRTLKFYINGADDEGALNHVINPGDKLLVSYGPASDPGINAQLQQIPPAY